MDIDAIKNILQSVEDTGNAIEKTGNLAEKAGNQADKAAGQVQKLHDELDDDDDFTVEATVTADTSQAQQAIDNIPKEVEIEATVNTSQVEQSADDIIKKLEEVKKTAVDTFNVALGSGDTDTLVKSVKEAELQKHEGYNALKNVDLTSDQATRANTVLEALDSNNKNVIDIIKSATVADEYASKHYDSLIKGIPTLKAAGTNVEETIAQIKESADKLFNKDINSLDTSGLLDMEYNIKDLQVNIEGIADKELPDDVTNSLSELDKSLENLYSNITDREQRLKNIIESLGDTKGKIEEAEKLVSATYATGGLYVQGGDVGFTAGKNGTYKISPVKPISQEATISNGDQSINIGDFLANETDKFVRETSNGVEKEIPKTTHNAINLIAGELGVASDISGEDLINATNARAELNDLFSDIVGDIKNVYSTAYEGYAEATDDDIKAIMSSMINSSDMSTTLNDLYDKRTAGISKYDLSPDKAANNYAKELIERADVTFGTREVAKLRAEIQEARKAQGLDPELKSDLAAALAVLAENKKASGAAEAALDNTIKTLTAKVNEEKGFGSQRDVYKKTAEALDKIGETKDGLIKAQRESEFRGEEISQTVSTLMSPLKDVVENLKSGVVTSDESIKSALEEVRAGIDKSKVKDFIKDENDKTADETIDKLLEDTFTKIKDARDKSLPIAVEDLYDPLEQAIYNSDFGFDVTSADLNIAASKGTRDLVERLRVSATAALKNFLKTYTGSIEAIIAALGDDAAIDELGIQDVAIADILKRTKAGSAIEGSILSALNAANEKNSAESEGRRKAWKDAAKASVITAKYDVDAASTTEEREAALKEYITASKIYAEMLKRFKEEGSQVISDSEIAKAKADIKKAKADLDESLEEVSKEAEEYIKGIKDQVKAITSDKSLSADEKAFKIQQIQQGYGYKVRNGAEAQAVQGQYNDLTKLNSDLMRASQAEDELKQKALDVAAANRKIAEADTTDKQITEHRNLASIYRQQAAATTDAAAREDLLTEATKEEARAQEILDKELAKARQIAKDAQQAFMQIVDMVNSATNKVIGLIRSSIGLANRGVNATVNGGQKIVSTLGRVVQLFGSLSNRVRSCIATVINFARSTTQALGRVLNGVKNLIAHFNIFNRQAAGKNGLSLAFTELNSAISLAERAFNGLFNNQLIQRAIKFDSTIASITMLLGGEATDDAQEFAKALQDGFNISYSQTISDLQEITTLLKAAGLEAAGLSKTGIVNAAEDLYSIAQYFGALGFQGGDVYEIMSKLQSGMKGMTISIDDLGLSVRETDMNEFLKKNNQNVKFSKLNEANKEAVRLGAILDQFKNNFDILDFSKLLEQPYYQISLIKSQITEIGTIIGKIFEGIISKYLPTILGALQLIRDTLEGIAGGLDIDLSGDKVQKSLDGIADAAGDITDGMDDAAKATKDYTNTAGFDEITSLNSGSDEQKIDIDKLLANVGNISDLLQEAAKNNIKDYETLMDKWSKFVKDTLGKDTDPFFGFNSGKAKKSLGNIGKNIQRWWKSFKETTLTLGLKFADDLQAGRFANDVLRLVDAITKLVAIIQEQLSPVVQDFYDKHLSKYVKEFGDKFNEFSKSFKKRVNQLDKDLKGGMTFGDAWKKNFGSILPPDLQTRLEKIVKIVKKLYKEYITPIKDAVLTTFDTIGTLSMGGLNIVDSTITKGEEGESLLDKVLGNYQTFSKDKLQPWIESTTNSIASYIETHKTETANLIDQIANDLFDVFTLLADIVGKLITWNIENPGMLNTIAETAKKVLGFVSDNFDTIMRIVELFIQLISASIDGLLSGIQIIFDKIAELDTVKPGEDKSQLQNIIDNVCKFIKAIWEDLGTGISNLLQWVSDNEGALTGALIVIEGLTSFFSNDVVGLLNAIIAIKTVTGIVSVIDNLKKLAGAIKTVAAALGIGGAGSAATDIAGAAAGAASGLNLLQVAIAGLAVAAIHAVDDIADEAIEPGEKVDNILESITVTLSSGWDALGGMLEESFGKLSGNAEMIEDGVAKQEEAAKKGLKHDEYIALSDIAGYYSSNAAISSAGLRAMNEYGVHSKDLEPFVKEVTDGNGNIVKTLDTTKLKIDTVTKTLSAEIEGIGYVPVQMYDEYKKKAETNAKKLEEQSEKQTDMLERIYDRIPTDAYQGMKEMQFKEDSGGYYQALQYAKRHIKIRALGGSVPSGQLFIANEAGNPELIGQIGKKTGADVANRGMITDAMETAVYNGLVDALNQSRQQATTGTSTPTTINVNGFGLIDKNALRQFAKILAPYLSANKDSFITA